MAARAVDPPPQLRPGAYFCVHCWKPPGGCLVFGGLFFWSFFFWTEPGGPKTTIIFQVPKHARDFLSALRTRYKSTLTTCFSLQKSKNLSNFIFLTGIVAFVIFKENFPPPQRFAPSKEGLLGGVLFLDISIGPGGCYFFCGVLF